MVGSGNRSGGAGLQGGAMEILYVVVLIWKMLSTLNSEKCFPLKSSHFVFDFSLLPNTKDYWICFLDDRRHITLT